MARELQDLESQGIIERSSSQWAAPIVSVPNKDKTIRICVDYQDVTTRCLYPMPRIDDLLDGVGQSRFIFKLDLTRWYWQVPCS